MTEKFDFGKKITSSKNSRNFASLTSFGRDELQLRRSFKFLEGKLTGKFAVRWQETNYNRSWNSSAPTWHANLRSMKKETLDVPGEKRGKRWKTFKRSPFNCLFLSSGNWKRSAIARVSWKQSGKSKKIKWKFRKRISIVPRKIELQFEAVRHDFHRILSRLAFGEKLSANLKSFTIGNCPKWAFKLCILCSFCVWEREPGKSSRKVSPITM
jgi:hypothetical protein